MAAKKDCGCGGKAKASYVTVQLAGGTKIRKKEADALAFSARHPGSKIIKAA
jgi:translation initiation factor 1 (eIF-1/SUI1)